MASAESGIAFLDARIAECADRDDQAAALTAPQIEARNIAELAALSPIEYDRVRTEKAEELGIRTETLDAEVKRQRRLAPKDNEMFPHPVPWPSEVSGSDLLDAIEEVYARFVVLPEHAAPALALWILLTYFHDREEVTHSPILAVTSAEMRCGKTSLLTVTSQLANKPLMSSNATVAAIFRAVEAWAPTLLIDEADSFLRDDEELRGIINSGHTRSGAAVLRTVEVNGSHEAKYFKTWCPKVIAGIRELPDTIKDRSIRIRMQRKLPGQKVEKLRTAGKNLFEDLRSQCQRFANDTVLSLADSPESLNDRAADMWEPLLALADAAGGRWPDRARECALALCGDADDADSIRVQLLKDIKATLDRKSGDRITSADLILVLNAMEERPWPEFSHGRPLTTRQLAKLLSAFGIGPKTIRTSKEDTFKGYTFESFADAFARYIPTDASQRHNPEQARLSTGSECITLRIDNPSHPSADAACDGVTDKKTAPRGAERTADIARLKQRVAAINNSRPTKSSTVEVTV